MKSSMSCLCSIAIGLLIPNCGSSSNQSAGSNSSASDCKLTTSGTSISLVCNGTITSTIQIPTGLQGPKGDTGATGAQGIQGPAGSQWQYAYSGTRLQAILTQGETWVGADGSKYTTPDDYYNLYDTTLGVNCSLGLASDSQKRCLPNQNASIFSSYYADSACTNLVAFYFTPTCGASAPKYIAAPSTGCGPTTTTFYQLGSTVTTIYYLSGTTCSAISAVAGYQFVQVGAVVPASSFVAFTTQ